MGGLSPYSHYDFRVAAVNTIGQGPSSDVVEARTAEQAPSSPPRQVWVLLGRSWKKFSFKATLILIEVKVVFKCKFPRFSLQVRGRMLSTTTAIIHWDEPEEPNGQVVGYRVYYTSDNTLPVNQVRTCVCTLFCFMWCSFLLIICLHVYNKLLSVCNYSLYCVSV